MNICHLYSLGITPYAEAWVLQNRLAAQIAAGERPPTLLLLEHPHTYTFGRRGNRANLLWDEAECARRGITIHWVDRGGDVTYHGPGQLVGYPLIPLGIPRPPSPLAPLPGGEGKRIPQADYVGYLRKLEQVLIRAVGALGVQAQQVDGLTGVWVSGEGPSIAKLAAIGVKVDAQGVTRHGFALNVNPEMAYWEGIIGCGLPHPQVSLAQLCSPTPAMDAVRAAVADAFRQVFACA